MKMYCGTCKKEFNEGFKFCPYCGAELLKREPFSIKPFNELTDNEKEYFLAMAYGLAVLTFLNYKEYINDEDVDKFSELSETALFGLMELLAFGDAEKIRNMYI